MFGCRVNGEPPRAVCGFAGQFVRWVTERDAALKFAQTKRARSVCARVITTVRSCKAFGSAIVPHVATARAQIEFGRTHNRTRLRAQPRNRNASKKESGWIRRFGGFRKLASKESDAHNYALTFGRSLQPGTYGDLALPLPRRARSSMPSA